MPLLLLLLIALLGSSMGLVYTHHQSRQRFMELHALEAQRDDLEIEWTLLRLEQSRLASEAQVDQVARSRLDMRIPVSDEVIYVFRKPDLPTAHPPTAHNADKGMP